MQPTPFPLRMLSHTPVPPRTEMSILEQNETTLGTTPATRILQHVLRPASIRPYFI